MADGAHTFLVTEVVRVPKGDWYRASDGAWTRDFTTERVTAEITLTPGGLGALAERAGKNKNGKANIGPLRAKVIRREPLPAEEAIKCS